MSAALGCSSGSSGDAATTDSGADGTAVDTGTLTDTTPTCPTLGAISAPKTARPGDVVTLSAEGGAALAWSVSTGTLDVASGSPVKWTLPSDAAVHVAEKATATVQLTIAGCSDQNKAVDVVVDWPDADRTMLVYDSARPGSKDVADAYASFRGLAADHECATKTSNDTSIPTAEFAGFVDTVMACATKIGAHVHTLVPTWGVPYKVSGQVADLADGTKISEVSLDALLVYGKNAAKLKATKNNPFFQGRDAFGATDSMDGKWQPYVPFGALRQKTSSDYFMVVRVDGADAAAGKALVDRFETADDLAKSGKLAGTVYVDGNKGLPHPTSDAFGSYESGEWNIIGVETVFKAFGKYPIVADYDPAEFGTAPAPLTAPDALYYAGWYSFGHYNDVFTWKPGAIGGHLDSCSACDIRGSVDWSAMALRRGITATYGAVNEPYVAGLPEYDQLFLYLTQGASFGEAAYEATAIGAWMVVFIGDPLYRPYPAPATP